MEASSRQTHFTRALLELRSLILDGEFKGESRLSESALATRFGISRTPMRQAMDRLVDEGLLVRLDTGRCRVASFTMNDIVDAIEIRGVLEGTAARLAAERGADEDTLINIQEVLAELDQTVFGSESNAKGFNFDSYVQLNARFHELLVELCASPVMQRESHRASRLPLASPSAFFHSQKMNPDFHATLKFGQMQHKAIVEAIVQREGARAEALTREHARFALQNLDLVVNAKSRLKHKVPGLALIKN